MIEDLVNRLRKRQKHLRKWARRRDITCYRLYEKDLPDQPLIIDWYDGDVVVWTLERKRNETEEQEHAWIEAVCQSIVHALDINEDQLFLKQRQRQKGKRQYERYGRLESTKTVSEHKLLFEVNLSDYLDLGLFLDHRPLRQMLRQDVAGKRVLNLFCYTGSFSIYAADGGAAHVCSVDLSNTYLDWLERNIALNNQDSQLHEIKRGDCIEVLHNLASSPQKFDVIICDPPTFSNSKTTDKDFIVQERHAELIHLCMRCLDPHGTLYFSTNFRKFQMDDDITRSFTISDISEKTIPEDFRNQRIHYCWAITHTSSQE